MNVWPQYNPKIFAIQGVSTTFLVVLMCWLRACRTGLLKYCWYTRWPQMLPFLEGDTPAAIQSVGVFPEEYLHYKFVLSHMLEA